MQLPYMKGPAKNFSDSEETWNLLFDKNVMGIIIKWTNVIQKCKN